MSGSNLIDKQILKKAARRTALKICIRRTAFRSILPEYTEIGLIDEFKQDIVIYNYDTQIDKLIGKYVLKNKPRNHLKT